MVFIQPLDLQHIFLNTFSGTATIFILLSYVAISIGASKMNMPNAVFLIMILLFSTLFSNFIGIGYLLILIVASLGIFTWLSKVVKN